MTPGVMVGVRCQLGQAVAPSDSNTNLGVASEEIL